MELSIKVIQCEFDFSVVFADIRNYLNTIIFRNFILIMLQLIILNVCFIYNLWSFNLNKKLFQFIQ
ncbi:hypothetical protein MEG1DRAFT_03208 [Photorhabdus temperata subsp. temperata Meg1]|uniref:Transmembrane protein n=1 Tax=Photorhabdus temperata subsp. temperata Meg1 TaxID=1393735 RepID=A0A081RU10_PHOTE|nr:hypothetical protein B738_10646 [Photorhabdus temperata subsp. temperata M1021]KER02163.1 hypothetical protein MEG1DRAFT_03208 [Photorhabdus temperata subsp. temperata Meg1]